MKRLPLIPTIVVAVAVATMVALGVWQLRRADEKAALKATYARNAAMSSIVAFPVHDPVRPELLFRKSISMCLRIGSWRTRAGEDVNGKRGYRQIAQCATGAEGPGFAVDMGVSEGFEPPRGFRGGEIQGTIVPGIDSSSLIARAVGKAPPVAPMLIADRPAPGLRASKLPSPEDIPDNHLAYAVQWFLFAGIALVIYALALRRRWH